MRPQCVCNDTEHVNTTWTEDTSDWIETYIHDADYWLDVGGHYLLWSMGMWGAALVRLAALHG